jgi:hypothetical protein
MLSTHLHLGLYSGLFPFVFSSNNVYATLFSIHAIYPVHLTLLDLIILTILGEEYKSRSSPRCAVFSTLPSFYPSSFQKFPQYYNILSLCSSLYVRSQVLHPYRTKHKITVLYILSFSTEDEKTEGSAPNGSKHYENSVSSSFLPESNPYITEYSVSCLAALDVTWCNDVLSLH